MVCVISKTGKKLMPTTERRCRKLLKAGRAEIVSLRPCTIQLLDNKTEYTQPIILSIDMGSHTIGYAVKSEGKKQDQIVFKGEVEQRAYVNAQTNAPVLRTRANYRRTRRYRKWYRKPRYLNRKRAESKCKACGNNTPTGKVLCTPCAKTGHHNYKSMPKESIWLPPTVKAKADLHIRIINVWNKYVPISKVVIETVSFDIQKILNPEISGQDYQQGEQLGFENVKMYVRHRDGYKCKMCGTKPKKVEVHHIKARRKQGASNPGNLVTLCRGCHEKITGKEKKYQQKLLDAIGSKGMGLAKTAQVNSFKEYILHNIALPHEETFGYITKCKRKELQLQKSHIDDAIAIAVSKLGKSLVDKSWANRSRSVRRAVRQQFKANAQKGKGFVRYRQPFNQIEGIGRGDICWHTKKRYKVVIDTLLTIGKFNAKEVRTGKRIGAIAPKYLKLLQKKRSLQF